jgi:hypothetical protein
VESTWLQKDKKCKEQLAEKHICRSWEKELEGVETYCQRQKKMEGTRSGQLMFLMQRHTLSLLFICNRQIRQNFQKLLRFQILTAASVKMAVSGI